uniref:Uncharacterized protein n=1 Tax=Panagrolaimus sp. JU765 TaxID=591449 RepID=A0AC34R9F4_9BILA
MVQKLVFVVLVFGIVAVHGNANWPEWVPKWEELEKVVKGAGNAAGSAANDLGRKAEEGWNGIRNAIDDDHARIRRSVGDSPFSSSNSKEHGLFCKERHECPGINPICYHDRCWELMDDSI